MSIKARVRKLEEKGGCGYHLVVPELRYVFEGEHSTDPGIVAREPGEGFRDFLARVDPACTRIIALAEGIEMTSEREEDEEFRRFQDRTSQEVLEAVQATSEPGRVCLEWAAHLL